MGRLQGRPNADFGHDLPVLRCGPSFRPCAATAKSATVYFGRDKAILRERNKIKKRTIQQRRLQHQKQAA
jgi:hypothetical protein